MKACTITKDNQNALAVQYNVDLADVEDLLPLGYVLIADFGGEWYEGVISQAQFFEFYVKGDTLENDYYLVDPK